MRNFKKVLSLVLCMAMMLSVMVVGAGAAFKDQNKIVNEEAVDMCSALNIINGYTDGSYRPEGNITRAEACKMICIALNGGKDPVLGTNATPTFTDIKGHWAEKYIEYCVSEGIVAGVGGGKFAPAGNVTGSQFAKMLLIAMGYRADAEDFVGSAWEVNVNVKASAKGLYEDLATMNPAVALNRDNAAQMVWNALNADMVKYDYKLSTVNGTLTSELVVEDIVGQTLLTKKYNTKDTDDTTGILTAISYNTTKDEYTYTVQELGTKNTLGEAQKYVTEADYTDLLGYNVTFVVKKTNNDVYGVYANDSVELVSGVMGDIDFADYAKDKTIEVDGVDYDVDALVTGVEYGATKHATDWDKMTADEVQEAEAYYEFSAIDWDDDDDIDLIIIYPVDIKEVSYVGSDYVKFLNTGTKYDIGDEDYTVYAGVAKEDYAVVSADTTLKTLGDIAKLDKLSGKVSSYNNKDIAVIDGTSYDYTTLGNDTAKLEGALDKKIDFRAINGYVVWIDATSSVDLSDYVVVTGVSEAKGVSGYYEAELLFTDGNSEVVTIKSVNEVKNAKPEQGDLYTYEVSSGKYELTPVDALPVDDYDASVLATNAWTPAESASDANAKVNFSVGSTSKTAKFASDAVIFVNDEGDYSVKTGADLAKVTGDATVKFAGAEKNSNNALSVTFAYIETVGISESDTQYGYVVSDISNSKDADGSYQNFTIWNGEKNVDLATADKVVIANIQKGSVISYKLDADGAVSEGSVVGTVGALTVIDGDEVTIDGTVYTIDDDDTTVLYVSNADEAGVADASIQVATEKEGTGYYNNVKFVVSSDGKTLDLLVVDIDNDWDGVID